MQTKQIVWIGLFLGSTIGGAIPMLWGAGIFDISSLLFSAVGACVGIYVGFKISQNM